MSLPISQVVDVTLQQSPQGAQKRDFSVAAIFTSEQCDEYSNPNSRYLVVSDVNQVATRSEERRVGKECRSRRSGEE